MNALRKKWQLDRIERAITAARKDESKRTDCLWPCVHLASSVAGGDIRLCAMILGMRLQIIYENTLIRVRLAFDRFWLIRIKGWTPERYEQKLDDEFAEIAKLIQESAQRGKI